VTIAAQESPRVRAIVSHLATSVLLANVIPAALFYLCFRAGNVWLALVAALTWCYGAIAWRKATRRPPSGLMWLTVVALTAKTALAFATGSTFLYFLQPALTDCVIAVVFLVSLATARPVVARLAADFYPMSRDVAERPRVQRLFWRLTFLWAVICLAKAVSTIWLLQELSVASFLTVKTVVSPSVAVGGAALTFWLALRVARHEGLIRTQRSS